jgi:hypothetical protein
VNAIAIHVLANVCLIAQSIRDFLRHAIRAISSASCSVERSTIKKDSNCFFLVLYPIAYAPKPKQGEARIVRNKNVNTRGIGHAGSHRLVAINEVLNIRDPIAPTSFKSPVLSVCIWLKPARSTPLVSVGVGGNVMHVGSPVLGCSIRRADSMAPCHKACRSFESSSSLPAHAVSSENRSQQALRGHGRRLRTRRGATFARSRHVSQPRLGHSAADSRPVCRRYP